MTQLESNLTEEICTDCCNTSGYCSHCVNFANLQDAFKFSKAGKSDGVSSTNHVNDAPPEVLSHCFLLFTFMTRHGLFSYGLLSSNHDRDVGRPFETGFTRIFCGVSLSKTLNPHCSSVDDGAVLHNEFGMHSYALRAVHCTVSVTRPTQP